MLRNRTLRVDYLGIKGPIARRKGRQQYIWSIITNKKVVRLHRELMEKLQSEKDGQIDRFFKSS